MVAETERYREALEAAKAEALRVEQANKKAGSPEQSTAYDAGRYAGLQEALDLLDRIGLRK